MEDRITWRKAKQAELKIRIQKLADKIVWVTHDIRRFGPQRVGSILKNVSVPRTRIVKHWHRMAQLSLRATRKKIYKLQAELKAL